MLLKILSLFSGIGAFEKALTNLNIEHEVVAWSEIDKFASKSYEVLHNPKGKNWGDITKIDETKLPKFDLMTYGFPCQDISVAGKQKGIELGTRSGLLYEALRILQYHRPKYAIAENVKNLVGKKHIEKFKALLVELEFYGYTSYWKVLNSKNYGVPQNRERVFIISIRKDVDDGKFEFPLPFDNGIRLKDILEDEVDEKYYINNEKVKKLIAQLDKGIDREGIDLTINNPKTREVANCIKARYDAGISNFRQDGTGICEGIPIKEATKKGYAIAEEGDSINIQFPNSKTRRGRVGKEVAQTLETQCNQAVIRPYLTPNRLGGIFDGEVKHQAGSVWDKEGISPTLDTMQGGYRQPSVIVRQTTKPTTFISIKIELSDGTTSKTIYEEVEVEYLESIWSNWKYGNYSCDCNRSILLYGIDKSFEECSEGKIKAKISLGDRVLYDDDDDDDDDVDAQILRRVRTEYGKKVRKQYEARKIKESRHNMTTLEPRHDDITNTLTTVQKDNLLLDNYRIRKLTPTECWLLQGFTKEDIQKCIDIGISNSQLYKQAGNSITVNVLEEIFKNLFKKE